MPKKIFRFFMAASSSSSNSSSKKHRRQEIVSPDSEKLYTKLTEGLNREQRRGFDLIVNLKKNVLITGQGGTGKSHLVRIVIKALKELYPRKVAVTAATGIAGILIDGSTFHRWTKLGLMKEEADVLLNKVLKFPKAKITWQGVQVLLIDEISMFDPTLLTKFDYIARRARKQMDLPFGGIQVIFIGDFLQIPPVAKNSFSSDASKDSESKDRYVFQTEAWGMGEIEIVHLTENLRQQDEVFQKILREVRFNQLSPESIEILNTRTVKSVFDIPANEQGVKPTVLMSLNADVDNYNKKKLDEITDQEKVVFTGKGMTLSNVHGNAQGDLEFLVANCPVPQTVHLKVGAQVMLRKNINAAEKLVNGNVGIVVSIDKVENAVYVKFNNRPTETTISKITPFTWEYNDGIGFPTAVYTQIPLCLAWAISIHKSQGQQFPYVAVDMGKIFETGQAYTALSRAESLEGLYLSNFNPLKIKACPIALNFYENLDTDQEVFEASSSVRPNKRQKT